MATPSEARAVKSLNKLSGGRRFVFKTFSQRIEEIDIDVYRSLDPLKAEPSQGSSFFCDCLVEYRELNTAEDFISIYEEIFPLVQTLPQIILQKDLIVSSLLSRLKMEGRLSHEPILRIALFTDMIEAFMVTYMNPIHTVPNLQELWTLTHYRSIAAKFFQAEYTIYLCAASWDSGQDCLGYVDSCFIERSAGGFHTDGRMRIPESYGIVLFNLPESEISRASLFKP
ncbi:hypothetical protein Sango_2405200 [Sesamum angolense]|uniref:Uncharacterized protein n=1 Tax=Sesamum angolense TaxID=2727404 RepID=A0AAE1W782_9LAMI|nr:hypothetical protein Sango_2405200 [Sesamum angolense]